MNKQLETKQAFFNEDFVVLKKGFYELVKESEISLGDLVELIHYAFDTVEKVALENIGDYQEQEALMRAIDADLAERGFFREQKYDLESRPISDEELDVGLAYLRERMEDVIRQTGLSPLYVTKKMHEAFEDIEIEARTEKELGKITRGEEETVSWDEIRANQS